MGGMGSITQALAAAGKQLGVENPHPSLRRTSTRATDGVRILRPVVFRRRQRLRNRYPPPITCP